MDSFTRVVHVATVARGDGRPAVPVLVTVKYDAAQGRVSFVGVEGPRRNGDAWGSCGQIHMGGELSHHVKVGAVYDRIAALWERWHLNDMRAGCEHQRAGWDVREELEVATYGLTADGKRMRRDAVTESRIAASEGRVANLTDTARELLKLSSEYATTHQPPDADSLLSGLYEVTKREKKLAGWVTEREHPRGLLTRPCEVCGYRYGSAWLREELPPEVLEELERLPDSGRALLPDAWVA